MPVGAANPAFKVRTVIHTDGGCDAAKDGLGAYAFVVHYPGEPQPVKTAAARLGTTNNRMEMMAVLEALSAVPMGPPVLVFSDSEYVIKGTTVWARGWIKNGWLTADGKPVKNKDLWLKLIALYQLHDVQFHHVKGHAGHQYNELCDQLCTEAMAQATKDMLAGQQIMLDDGGPKAVYDART